MNPTSFHFQIITIKRDGLNKPWNFYWNFEQFFSTIRTNAQLLRKILYRVCNQPSERLIKSLSQNSESKNKFWNFLAISSFLRQREELSGLIDTGSNLNHVLSLPIKEKQKNQLLKIASVSYGTFYITKSTSENRSCVKWDFLYHKINFWESF